MISEMPKAAAEMWNMSPVTNPDAKIIPDFLP